MPRRDLALERTVAIKLLPPELAAQHDLRERFLREARTAANLGHPRIVPIHLVEAYDAVVFWRPNPLLLGDRTPMFKPSNDQSGRIP